MLLEMPFSTSELVIFDERAECLEGTLHNIYSQNGEDGVIHAAFDWLGETNRWCFEVGAADGVYLSNTRALIDAGWSAVLIEQHPLLYHQLASRKSENVHTVRASATESNISELLTTAGLPIEPDFGVIDIDGQDYWLWQGLGEIRPRLMLVEYWRSLGSFVPPRGSDTGSQASLSSIIELGERLGYVALAATFVNVLFARRDVLENA